MDVRGASRGYFLRLEVVGGDGMGQAPRNVSFLALSDISFCCIRMMTCTVEVVAMAVEDDPVEQLAARRRYRYSPDTTIARNSRWYRVTPPSSQVVSTNAEKGDTSLQMSH